MSNDQVLSNTNSPVRPIEQCAICMEHLTTQEVGVPENCEHAFCLVCLIEWAKVKIVERQTTMIDFFFSSRKIIHVLLTGKSSDVS